MSHTVEVRLNSQVESTPETQANPSRLYLLYHELRSSKTRYSYVTDITLFKKHIDLYHQLRQAYTASLWPEITFDDGHISNSELAAPILESRGLKASFFITAGWTGKKSDYMGWQELRALHQAGHSIGAHGWTHTLLTHCDERQLQIELRNTRLTMEDQLGISVATMSLPGGRYNNRVLKACEKAGYTQIYTSIPKATPVPADFTLGRLNILGDMQPEWIAKLFDPDSSLLTKIGKQYRRKEMAKKILGDTLYANLWALANRKERETDNSQDIAT